MIWSGFCSLCCLFGIVSFHSSSVYHPLETRLSLSTYMWGSMCIMRRLHLARSCATSPDNSLSDKSLLMLSNHPRFGIPLLLFPGTSIVITFLPRYSFSLLNTCPYYFNLLPCTDLDISSTFDVPIIEAVYSKVFPFA